MQGLKKKFLKYQVSSGVFDRNDEIENLRK